MLIAPQATLCCDCKEISEALVKRWSYAEAVDVARRRQQELLLWHQRMNRREKFRRRRDIQRGVAHIFVTAAGKVYIPLGGM